MLSLGLREGEGTGLKAEDIDLEPDYPRAPVAPVEQVAGRKEGALD